MKPLRKLQRGSKKHLRKFKQHQKFIKLFPETSQLLIQLIQEKSADFAILEKLAAMEQFLAETKLRLDSNISHKIVEKLTDNRSILRQASQTITSKIYDDILLEYYPKYQSIKPSLKSLMTEIENLEEQIERLELKLDGYDQNALLDSLVIQGIKQKPGVSLNTTLLGVFNQNIDGNILRTDSTYQLRMNNTSQSQNSFGKVPLVFVKITSQDLAYKIGDPSA